MTDEAYMKKIVTVFGSSSPQRGEPLYETAYELGKRIAEAGFILKNGGYGGTMAAGARGAIEAGGKVIGVTLEGTGWRSNNWLSEEIRAKNLFERLNVLMNNASGFIVLPGSTGTLAEVCLVIELVGKGLLPRSPVIFIGDYWDKVLEVIKKIALGSSDFIKKASSPAEAVDIIKGVRGQRHS